MHHDMQILEYLIFISYIFEIKMSENLNIDKLWQFAKRVS